MGIALTLQQYLDDQGIEYDTITHKQTGCSADTADASQVSCDCLAKGVVVKRNKGYLLAIVPASRQVELDELGRWLKQPVDLASEQELGDLFHDCDVGAVPPVGAAYGLRAVVDERLDQQQDVYFEAGDHRTLVHLSGAEFHRLMEKVPHERFSA
ncbi:MAG: YbaK/EbsC family protein [Pirellulales bacterium]|nr:YbaK/EbsC family protein [Pirellulales bacterium]